MTYISFNGSTRCWFSNKSTVSAIAHTIITVHNYGMNASKHRTSFALDEITIDRIRRLARRWGASQAEVVRRAVKIAADQSESESEAVQERLQEYRRSQRLDRETADTYLKQVGDDRSRWRAEP